MTASHQKTLSSIYKSLQDFISKTINDAISGKDKSSTLYRTIRGLIFTNLPPKVGFLDQTKVPIFGTYNMSNSRGHGFCFTDSEGRETIFKRCSNTPYTPLELSGVFRATRMKSDEEFIWENTPIVPKFVKEMPGYVANEKGPLFDNIRVTEVLGVNNGIAILKVKNKVNNTDKNFLTITNNSGSASNWGKYVEISLPDYIWYKTLNRISYNGSIYYITAGIEKYNTSFINPLNGNSISIDDATRIKIIVYKANENFDNHTVNLIKIREDIPFDSGENKYSYIPNNGDYINIRIIDIGMVYVSHANLLLLFSNSVNNKKLINYNNSLSLYDWNYYAQYSLCDIKNVHSVFTSTTDHYFENRNNWISDLQDIIYDINKRSHTDKISCYTSLVYDDLKRSVNASFSSCFSKGFKFKKSKRDVLLKKI